MVSAAQALRMAKADLTAAGVEDAAFDARELLCLALGGAARGRGLTGADRDIMLDAQQAAYFAALVRRRAAREPLQYLCGTWGFMDFSLAVGPGVLIPRADTEVVCEAAVAAAHDTQESAPVVVDLCSGTGALAIGVARAVPPASVTAVELSPDAYAYLRQNTAALAPHIVCVQADVFVWQRQCVPSSIDLLIANPPYITAQEMEHLAPELAFEPRMALEGAEEGLAFYRHIAAQYRFALKRGGRLVFEIGSTQAAAVCDILRAAGYEQLCVTQDYGGNDRCVTART